MTPLEAFERLHWTWLGPSEVRDEYGVHFEMRIAELPTFFVAAESAEEVEREKAEALRAFLASYVERDELLPIQPPTIAWEVVIHEVGGLLAAENACVLPLHLTRVAS
jgi:predicted RNase H-like HicB family nuclease